jgi:hypothetical protein
MADERQLIDPAWLVKARKDRKAFAVRVLIVFSVLSILAWWALPRLESQYGEFSRSAMRKVSHSGTEPASIRLLSGLAGWFKVLWVAIAIGCGAGVLLAFTGKIDTLVPVLNIAVLLLGAGALGLTFYVFYAPTLLALEAVR